MRKLSISLAAFAMMFPGTAMACHNGQASSINMSCESGVKVYRATPMAAPAAPIIIRERSDSHYAKQLQAIQNERLAAQADRIDALESRLEDTQSSQRRRGYSAPVGAFGAAPFVNRRRGFKNRRSGIKVRYNRRIRS